MKDDFEATFVVEISPDDVWKALTERTIEGDGDGEMRERRVRRAVGSLERTRVEGTRSSGSRVSSARDTSDGRRMCRRPMRRERARTSRRRRRCR